MSHRTYVIIILLTPRLHLQDGPQPFYRVHIVDEFEASRIRPTGQGTNGQCLPTLPEALHFRDRSGALRAVHLCIIDVDNQKINRIVPAGYSDDSANLSDPGAFETHLQEHHLLSHREFPSMHQVAGFAHLAQWEHHSLRPSASSIFEQSRANRISISNKLPSRSHLPASTLRIFAQRGKSRLKQ